MRGVSVYEILSIASCAGDITVGHGENGNRSRGGPDGDAQRRRRGLGDAYLFQELLLMMLEFAHHIDEAVTGLSWVVSRECLRCLRDDDEDPKNYLTGVQRALAVA